jgi:hypothetical protein
VGDGFQKGLVVCLGQIRMVHRLLQNALGVVSFAENLIMALMGAVMLAGR